MRPQSLVVFAAMAMISSSAMADAPADQEAALKKWASLYPGAQYVIPNRDDTVAVVSAGASHDYPLWKARGVTPGNRGGGAIARFDGGKVEYLASIEEDIADADVSPDKRFAAIATTSGYTVMADLDKLVEKQDVSASTQRLYNKSLGQFLNRRLGGGSVSSVKFSDSGKYVAVGYAEGKAMVFERRAEGWSHVTSFREQPGRFWRVRSVSDLAFREQAGSVHVSASFGGASRTFKVK